MPGYYRVKQINFNMYNMKKTATHLLPIVAVAFMLASCGNGKAGNDTDADTSTTTTSTTDASPTAVKPSSFDINNIPVSGKELGNLPFFSLPEGLVLQNRKAVERKFDRLFFPIDGIMTPIEGRVWKSRLTPESKKYSDWSLPYFEKSYDEAITAVGGVKIFDGKVSQEELDRIKDQATYFGEDGSIDYWNVPVKVYVIRRADGGDIYIQLSGNTAGGSLQILQKEAFKQTITLLKSNEIKKQLDEKGKAVLHINFDTDKASLKPEGTEAVKEITKVLQSDNNLKIAINGYTDNTGNADHNQQLSEARAETVKKEIIAVGIDAGRLTSKGFGQENPIADNGTEEGKAQNRRVELVKL